MISKENDPTKNNIIIELLRNIFHDIISNPSKPFFLGLLEYHQEGIAGLSLNDDALISILYTLRTYLIRNRVLRLTANEGNHLAAICKRIGDLATDFSTATDKDPMIEMLSQYGYTRRMPNDIEISAKLIDINFFETFDKLGPFLLGKIEEKKSGTPVDFRDTDKTQIIRIFPPNLSND